MVLRPFLTLLFSHTLCVRLFPSERWHHSVNDKSSFTMCWQCFNGSTHLIDAMATFFHSSMLLPLLLRLLLVLFFALTISFAAYILVIWLIFLGNKWWVQKQYQNPIKMHTIIGEMLRVYGLPLCVCVFLWCVWCYPATFTTESMRTSNVTHIKCEKNQLYTNQFFHSRSLSS